MKVAIIGSGISGATAARVMRDAGHEVIIWEAREHIAGNCYDEDREGVRVHCYGPHLFHTNDAGVWKFLSRFTEWNAYEHRVVADTGLGRIAIPYNLRTEAQLGRRLSDEEIRELIFVEYSEKQWGVPWSEMPTAIRGRVPIRRENEDDRYFTDRFQGQPREGYTAMFQRMLEGIPVELGVGKEEWRKRAGEMDWVVYTGKVDEYFGYAYGRLPYRSLRFEHERSAVRLPFAQINQCNGLPFTRMYDHRWLSGQGVADEVTRPVQDGIVAGAGLVTSPSTTQETILTREYPLVHDLTNEPYYPMPCGEGMALYQRYKLLAEAERRTLFIGRLATYSYLDMWMAVAQAMVKLRGVA